MKFRTHKALFPFFLVLALTVSIALPIQVIAVDDTSTSQDSQVASRETAAADENKAVPETMAAPEDELQSSQIVPFSTPDFTGWQLWPDSSNPASGAIAEDIAARPRGLSGIISGYFTIGSPGLADNGTLGGANFYMLYSKQNGSKTVLPYLYQGNSTHTTHFNVYYYDEQGTLVIQDLSEVPIDSIWTQERTNDVLGGYNFRLVGHTVINDIPVKIIVTMEFDYNYNIRHSWEIANEDESNDLEIGFLAEIYPDISTHTSVWLAISKESSLLALVESEDPNDDTFSEIDIFLNTDSSSVLTYAPVSNPPNYTSYELFGDDLSGQGTMWTTDKLYEVISSGENMAVFYKWEPLSITSGESQAFSYLVTVWGHDEPDLSTLPATGDSTTLLSICFLFLIFGTAMTFSTVVRRKPE